MNKSKYLAPPADYLSGPMSGYPKHNYPAFLKAEEELSKKGLTIANPARINVKGLDWNGCMVQAISMLVKCNRIILLPGWEKSKGATAELWLARLLKMPVLYYNGKTLDWLQPSKKTILEEAQSIVHGDRKAAYGHPFDNFTLIGQFWAIILRLPQPVPPQKVALMMICLKIAREMHASKKDNQVDIAGFAETLDMVNERFIDLFGDNKSSCISMEPTPDVNPRRKTKKSTKV